VAAELAELYQEQLLVPARSHLVRNIFNPTDLPLWRSNMNVDM
jgi:hypothetical protein